MKKILQKILRMFAKTVLAKYRPLIVGVTGSVGKSSTKEAIALVLSREYDLRKNEGNYNNEIGIPLTILGEKSGGRSFLAWVRICFRWVWLMVAPCKYPKVLVLEMAVDHPGDMEYLLGFIPVDVGVMTRVGESHLEHFKTVAGIAKEKGKIVTQLSPEGIAILNMDDERIIALNEKTKAKIVTYSMEQKNADISGEHYSYDDRTGVGWMFKLNYEGKSVPVRLPNIVGKHLISSALAALAVGLSLKMNLVDILAALEQFESLPGRMRIISGSNGSMLIDDTYNASPASLHASLETIGRIRAQRKILALGDMLELGPNSERFHRECAEDIMKLGVSGVFVIGPMMSVLGEELQSRGFSPERIYRFNHPSDLGQAIAAFVAGGDVVLFKGSRGMRMEKAVEAAMEHPEDASGLLCCQSPEWRSKPFAL